MTEPLAELFSKLPQYLGWHLFITTLSLALGIFISLPLGVFAARRPLLRWPALAFAGVLQTVPALAFLALWVAVLFGINESVQSLWGPDAPHIRAIGFLPTIIAMTLYSMLPILRNTITGILGVEASLIEAADALGMRPGQRLWKVELPLAAPVILAGIRTATVWTVGIATLATLVGQPCLGNYIFEGLQTMTPSTVLFGCLVAALLAIVRDQVVGLLESGVSVRSRPRMAAAALCLLLVVAGGTAPLVAQAVRRHRADLRRVEVGAKTFNESYILAELIGDLLGRSYDVQQRRGLGSMVAFDGLRAGDLDCYVDYSGTVWATVMKRDEVADARTVLSEMTQWLAREHGIRCLGSLGFENAYALAVRRELAERLNLRTVEDLVPVAGRLSICSDPEFFGRAEWRNLKQTYGLEFREQISMQSSLMYQAAGGGEVDVITAYTSDGRITRFDLVVLDDNRSVFPPYEAVLLLSPKAARSPPLVERLQWLIGAIDVEAMRRANLMVDVENQSIAAAARWLRHTAMETPPAP